MALPTPETQAKVASEAAQSFVDHFYETLNKRRPLAPFYASASPRLTAAGVVPDISINGLVLPSVSAYESLLDTQAGGGGAGAGGSGSSGSAHVNYDVASFDAHPVNPVFRIGEPETDAGAAVKSGDRLSFAVQVSGVVRYGRGRRDDATAGAGGNGDDDAPLEKPFNEAFLLVPHWEAWARNAPRGLRRWVIVSQNFRAL
ncbi:uncharacterized protein F4812DRAFT_420159 [Daldinia caldariorum]|uniref:uncharacterized protein n=1 Tax=Daldinia caldariorum TaxID=326644 RepID=UPI002008C870|nr:uncharacterized protein F4812DRAFT_420159 [Daldinia caldariorum]KAI1469737.1 hypothetical protein F4812DRAFT_420159 [Daldinia caldariorum]